MFDGHRWSSVAIKISIMVTESLLFKFGNRFKAYFYTHLPDLTKSLIRKISIS